MRKVLVTGADGFIGSHLVEMLLRQGFDVRALAQYNSIGDWGWLEEIQGLKEVEVVSGDIRDPFLCKKITKDVDQVFHLAALIAIPYSYAAPQSYIETNVSGTLNLCQAALENGARHFLHTSTSEVYGTARFVPISEDHPLQPQSPYSASKIGADAVAMSHYLSFQLPLTIVRPFNTFGPRQSARAVIPAIISQIASGKKEISLGDVSPTRDFNYVEDTCRGFVEIAKSGEKTIGQTLNVGSSREISIGATFELIKSLMGADHVRYKEDAQRLRPKSSEVHRLVCDSTRIRQLIGFEPKVSFEEGLKKTIEWFTKSENLRRYKGDLYHV